MINILIGDNVGTAFGFNSDEVTDIFRDNEYVKIYLPHSRILNVEAKNNAQAFDIATAVWENDKKRAFAVNRVWETIRAD